MSSLLDFQFLAILNLLACLTWPVSGRYIGARTDAINIILTILAAFAIVLDVVYLVLRLVHKV